MLLLSVLLLFWDIDFKEFYFIFVILGIILEWFWSHFGVILESWGVLARQKGPWSKKNEIRAILEGMPPWTPHPKIIIFRVFLLFLQSVFSGLDFYRFFIDSGTSQDQKIMQNHWRVCQNQGFAKKIKVWFRGRFFLNFKVILEAFLGHFLIF